MQKRQFIYSLRQLWAMHQRTGRDFAPTVSILANQYANTLISEGMPSPEAFDTAEGIAVQEYRDFTPIKEIPF